MNASTSSAPVSEPSTFVIYALAAGMGLILGPILAIAQWLELRHHLPQAGWWIPANALAWSAGMMIIFYITDIVSNNRMELIHIIFLAGIGLAFAGLVVGAIHGSFLLLLLNKTD